MVIPAPVRVERFFLAHGSHANAHSVAFDPDLERFVSPFGVLAHAECKALRTTMVFYDPLCAADDAPALLDEFIAAHRATSNGRLGFWKVSRRTASLLADRGFRLAAYGRENEVEVPLHLGGTAMRGLRRQVERARDDGVVISAIPASTPANAPLWDELVSRLRQQSAEVADVADCSDAVLARTYSANSVSPPLTARGCRQSG